MVLLDFAADLCDFGQESIISNDPGGAGFQFLDCPTPEGNSFGGALTKDSPTLDGGQMFPGPQLLIYPPQNNDMGAHVSVEYDYVAIEAGDMRSSPPGAEPASRPAASGSRSTTSTGKT